MSNQNQNSFDEILNTCLDLLHSGASVTDCLNQYPEMQAELQPILELTVLMDNIPFEQPSAGAISAGKAKMQAAIEAKTALQTAETSSSQFVTTIRTIYQFLFSTEASPMTRVTRSALASLLLVFSFFFTLNASANSLPGDITYPIKRLGERTRISLAAEDQKGDVRTQIASTRIQELDRLLVEGRDAMVTLDGEVTIIDDKTVIVEGFEINLNDETEQHIEFKDGDIIEITALLSEGTITATEIDISELNDLADEEDDEDDSVDEGGIGGEESNENENVPTPSPVAPQSYPEPEATETPIDDSIDNDDDDSSDNNDEDSNDDDDDSNDNSDDDSNDNSGDDSNDNDDDDSNDNDDEDSNDNEDEGSNDNDDEDSNDNDDEDSHDNDDEDSNDDDDEDSNDNDDDGSNDNGDEDSNDNDDEDEDSNDNDDDDDDEDDDHSNENDDDENDD